MNKQDITRFQTLYHIKDALIPILGQNVHVQFRNDAEFTGYIITEPSKDIRSAIPESDDTEHIIAEARGIALHDVLPAADKTIIQNFCAMCISKGCSDIAIVSRDDDSRGIQGAVTVKMQPSGPTLTCLFQDIKTLGPEAAFDIITSQTF